VTSRRSSVVVAKPNLPASGHEGDMVLVTERVPGFVGGHLDLDLPAGGQEEDAMAITERDRIR
jgi:hypothetical protein